MALSRRPPSGGDRLLTLHHSRSRRGVDRRLRVGGDPSNHRGDVVRLDVTMFEAGRLAA